MKRSGIGRPGAAGGRAPANSLRHANDSGSRGGHSGAEPPQKSRLSATAEASVMLPEGRRQPTWCSVSEVFRKTEAAEPPAATS